MKCIEWTYDLLNLFLSCPLKFLSNFSRHNRQGKFWEGLKMRQGEPWLNQPPQADRPLWFHASSGELEYARPILRLLRDNYPRTPTILTYFSPSAKKLIAKTPEIQTSFPSPWDTPQDVRRFIRHHNPQALLIARSDLWPNMLRECARAGIPSLMFSTTITKRHMKGFKKFWYRTWLPYLTEAWGVSDEDVDHLRALGVVHSKKMGDTRYDQVQNRLSGPIDPFWRAAPGAKPRLVLGSVWPEDERVWLQLMPELAGQFQVVWVPHEIHADHIKTLQEKLTELGVRVKRSTERTPPSPDDVLIVDEVGVLAFLYKSAGLAFVGGSFKDKVHSVMEPLGAGCPVITGPHIQNNREALTFSKFPLTNDLNIVQPVQGADELKAVLPKYLELNRERTQEQIINLFREHTGASQLVLEWLEQTVDLI
jgi:3-deoxy-D-manno-octulosonic-acid transferase